MAEKEKPLRCFIDTKDFMTPDDYIQMIPEYCAKTGQFIPQTDSEIARCVFDSLAMKYKQTYLSLKRHMNDTEKIYIVGGGVNNHLMNQLTADALGICVMTGPSEATIVGNLIVQMESLGEINGRNEAIDIINFSFDNHTYEPKDFDLWNEAYIEYQRLFSKEGLFFS